MNPAAGGRRALRAVPAIRAALRDRMAAADLVFSQGPGNAAELAYQGARAGYAPIVGVGGDGTLQEVVNGLLRVPHPPPLGIVPVGTGNDFARGLALPATVEEAVCRIHEGAIGAVDVARCGIRYYLNVGGAGFDAQVAAAVNGRRWRWLQGPFPYLLCVLQELWRYTNQELVLHLDGHTLHRRALLVAVANGPFAAGGMRICPQAVPTDGLLDVCIVGDVARREVLALLPRVFTGGHARHPKVEFYRARTVQIEGPAQVRVHVDGESVGHLPGEFHIVPGGLRVIGVGSGHAAPTPQRKE
ncbi:MAG: diacylglycerol kinase family lipid kinase [Chloroflexi bacterium]|nr:diacylglycerol kinase family lipid kinase [Chloroflexota bacterium]